MKDFLLLANVNAITYNDVFPLLKEGKVRGGYNFNKTLMFETLEGEKSGPNIAWFTSLPTPNKRKLILTKTYNPQDYPKYDNYDAIEVSRIKDIPKDYDYVMGVPITIFGYDLDNVEVQGLAADYGEGECFVRGTPVYVDEQHPKSTCMVLDNKAKYARILIRRKQDV